MPLNLQKSYLLRAGISQDCVVIYFQGFQETGDTCLQKLGIDRIYLQHKMKCFLFGFAVVWVFLFPCLFFKFRIYCACSESEYYGKM